MQLFLLSFSTWKSASNQLSKDQSQLQQYATPSDVPPPPSAWRWWLGKTLSFGAKSLGFNPCIWPSTPKRCFFHARVFQLHQSLQVNLLLSLSIKICSHLQEVQWCSGSSVWSSCHFYWEQPWVLFTFISPWRDLFALTSSCFCEDKLIWTENIYSAVFFCSSLLCLQKNDVDNTAVAAIDLCN